MKTGHEMCPPTNDHGSGITGHRQLQESSAMGAAGGRPRMCAQVAPAYGLRDSRTHPDKTIEALIKRSTKGNWTLL